MIDWLGAVRPLLPSAIYQCSSIDPGLRTSAWRYVAVDNSADDVLIVCQSSQVNELDLSIKAVNKIEGGVASVKIRSNHPLVNVAICGVVADSSTTAAQVQVDKLLTTTEVQRATRPMPSIRFLSRVRVVDDNTSTVVYLEFQLSAGTLQVVNRRTISSTDNMSLVQHVAMTRHELYYLLPSGYVEFDRDHVVHPVYGTFVADVDDVQPGNVNDYGAIYRDSHGLPVVLSWAMGELRLRLGLMDDPILSGRYVVRRVARTLDFHVYDLTTGQLVHQIRTAAAALAPNTLLLHEMKVQPLAYDAESECLVYHSGGTLLVYSTRTKTTGQVTMSYNPGYDLHMFQWIADRSLLVVHDTIHLVLLRYEVGVNDV